MWVHKCITNILVGIILGSIFHPFENIYTNNPNNNIWVTNFNLFIIVIQLMKISVCMTYQLQNPELILFIYKWLFVTDRQIDRKMDTHSPQNELYIHESHIGFEVRELVRGIKVSGGWFIWLYCGIKLWVSKHHHQRLLVHYNQLSIHQVLLLLCGGAYHEPVSRIIESYENQHE